MNKNLFYLSLSLDDLTINCDLNEMKQISTKKAKIDTHTHERHRSRGSEKPIRRYEIRKDGFACVKANAKEEIVVTKPFVFEGKLFSMWFE